MASQVFRLNPFKSKIPHGSAQGGFMFNFRTVSFSQRIDGKDTFVQCRFFSMVLVVWDTNFGRVISSVNTRLIITILMCYVNKFSTIN